VENAVNIGGVGMIDIHSHILPGVDDGAKNIAESLEMARSAVNEGIHTIIATPHYKNGKYEVESILIEKSVKELNEQLRKEKVNLTVLTGQEPRIFGEILEDYAKGKVICLADSSYLFIEFPSSSVPRYTDRLLYDLQVKRLQPIIVHPERNVELIENPNKLFELVEKGAATQVTAASVVGYFGKKIQRFSEELIEANLTHFIASDAHNVTNRSFKMKEAYSHIENRFGIATVDYFKENAMRLVEGKNIIREIPSQIKRKKFLGLFNR
jgi:protein-tyrosine phosphatase